MDANNSPCRAVPCITLYYSCSNHYLSLLERTISNRTANHNLPLAWCYSTSGSKCWELSTALRNNNFIIKIIIQVLHHRHGITILFYYGWCYVIVVVQLRTSYNRIYHNKTRHDRNDRTGGRIGARLIENDKQNPQDNGVRSMASLLHALHHGRQLAIRMMQKRRSADWF